MTGWTPLNGTRPTVATNRLHPKILSLTTKLAWCLEKTGDFFVRWGWLLGVIILAIVVTFLLSGCNAVGRGPNGEIIWGRDIATLPETGSELAGAAGHAIAAATGWTWLEPVIGLVGLLFGGAATHLARNRADASYDEGALRGALAGMAQAYAADRKVRDPAVDPPPPAV